MSESKENEALVTQASATIAALTDKCFGVISTLCCGKLSLIMAVTNGMHQIARVHNTDYICRNIEAAQRAREAALTSLANENEAGHA